MRQPLGIAVCLLSFLTLPLSAREDTEESREAYAPIAFFFEDIAEEEARGRFYRKVLQSIEEYLDSYPEGETADLARFHRAESNWFLGNKVKAEEGWTSVLESSDPRLSVKSHVRLADYFFESTVSEKETYVDHRKLRGVVRWVSRRSQQLRSNL